MTEPGPDAKVLFPLVVDSDGWPPVGGESVWAYSLGNDAFRIDNVPWFVRDLAVADVVEAIASDERSKPVFTRMLERSDHLTIRLICIRSGPLQGNLRAVVDAFTPLGVYAEGVAQYGLVALDVPPGIPLRPIHTRLVAGQRDGSWEWEEGRINDAWIAASEHPPKRRLFRRST